MDNIILENMYFSHNISSLTDKYIIECYEDSYMCESVLDSIKTFFSNLKEKIKDIFNKIINAITGKSKDNTNKLNEIEDKIKDNPELGKQKVQIADPDKVENEIDKQKKEYLNNKNKEKGKFKVDKKKVITVATVTVSLAAAVVLLKKGIIKLPSKAKKSQDEVNKTINKCEEEANKAVENTKEDIRDEITRKSKLTENEQYKIEREKKAAALSVDAYNEQVKAELEIIDQMITEADKVCNHMNDRLYIDFHKALGSGDRLDSVIRLINERLRNKLKGENFNPNNKNHMDMLKTGYPDLYDRYMDADRKHDRAYDKFYKSQSHVEAKKEELKRLAKRQNLLGGKATPQTEHPTILSYDEVNRIRDIARKTGEYPDMDL
jgi:hypothetical protein